MSPSEYKTLKSMRNAIDSLLQEYERTIQKPVPKKDTDAKRRFDKYAHYVATRRKKA